MVPRPPSGVIAAPAGRGGDDDIESRRPRLGILVIGDERVASTRFRVLAHLPALSQAGYEVTVACQGNRPSQRLARLPIRMYDEIRDLRRVSACDVLLVHRRCYPRWFTPLLGRHRRAIIFDIDDALFLPSPEEPQTASTRRRYRQNFDATTEIADLVLCGNAELAGEVRHDRTQILPTAVDCERFHPDALRHPVSSTAGWVGHSSNLGYLESIAGALREIASRHPRFKLIVVADREPRLDGVPIEFRRWTLARELENFRGIGIGLMPLPDTPWTRAKCSFKLLQYMALGIPSVASPVGMNREVLDPEINGLVASTDEQWVASLDALITNPETGRRLGRSGRETVVRDFSLPVISHRLIACVEEVAMKRPRALKLS